MEEPHSAGYRIMTAVKITNFRGLELPWECHVFSRIWQIPRGDHMAVINR